MPNTPFSPDKDFEVREDTLKNLLIGASFLVLVFTTVDFVNGYVIIFFLVFALMFIKIGLINKTFIIINTSGIYYCNKLVSNWENFTNAYFKKMRETNTYKVPLADFLIIEHYSTAKAKNVLYKIKFTPFPSKSNKEVIAAIKYYYALSKNNALNDNE